MRIVNIVFLVLNIIHAPLLLLMISDIVYVEILTNGDIGLGGLVVRITILSIWSSLVILSIIYLIIVSRTRHWKSRFTEANLIIAAGGITLGAYIVIPFLF